MTAKLVEPGDVNSLLSHDKVLQVFYGTKIMQRHWRWMKCNCGARYHCIGMWLILLTGFVFAKCMA